MSNVRITQAELQDMDMRELVDNVGALSGSVHFEGRSGLVTLCRLARALGYKDMQRFGQLDRNAFVGDLMAFLEDNSGAVESIVDWVCKVGDTPGGTEMKQRLGTVLVEAGAVSDDE